MLLRRVFPSALAPFWPNQIRPGGRGTYRYALTGTNTIDAPVSNTSPISEIAGV